MDDVLRGRSCFIIVLLVIFALVCFVIFIEFMRLLACGLMMLCLLALVDV